MAGRPRTVRCDQNAYTAGWFGLRTTWSRLRFKDFAVWRLATA